MTKKLFILCAALVWTVALVAQNISVVAANGSTKLYRTLEAAIKGADPNSVIYLPGGGFPIADSVKITKKLTIIGIGHKIKTENPDGYTTISGNLFFNQGSDESALMGCYVTGTVLVGNDGTEVDDVLIRCNNINHVGVGSECLGTNVNQNYLREGINFYGTSGRLTNNITNYVLNLDDGYISNNIITGYYVYNYASWLIMAMYDCDRTSITNNIIIDSYILSGSDCFASGNMCVSNWGDDCINVGSVDWNNVFVKNNGVSATSDFKFKGDYTQYEGQVGIYHGTFNDDQLAPVPYIVAKKIDEQTDAAGKLNIKIRVKASGEE